MTNDDGDVMYFPEGELKSHQWISSGLMIILDLFHFLSLRKKRNGESEYQYLFKSTI